MTLSFLCWSQAPYQIPGVQNCSFRLLHIPAFHGRTIVMLCLGSGCLLSQVFVSFFFFLMCKGTEKLWKVLLCALLQLWHMTPHRDFDVTTLLFSLWYWCIYSKNTIPYCFFLGFLKPKSQAHVVQDLLFVWFRVFSSWLLLTWSCWSDHWDGILPVLIWSKW